MSGLRIWAGGPGYARISSWVAGFDSVKCLRVQHERLVNIIMLSDPINYVFAIFEIQTYFMFETCVSFISKTFENDDLLIS